MTTRRFAANALLALRIWGLYIAVRWRVGRRPIPDHVADLAHRRDRSRRRTSPSHLRRAVERTLRVGPWRPRCVVSALVLFRLLRDQGDHAELVIGLPANASSHEAHAWVEIDGVDVGPAPGRAGHEPLARFA